MAQLQDVNFLLEKGSFLGKINSMMRSDFFFLARSQIFYDKPRVLVETIRVNRSKKRTQCEAFKFLWECFMGSGKASMSSYEKI